jgi:hypothetical protein
MIGEYLGRVHLNINRKPQYTIRDAHGLTATREHGMEGKPFVEEAA